MRIIAFPALNNFISRSCTANPSFPSFLLLSSQTHLSRFRITGRLLQTMCQGHEDADTAAARAAPSGQAQAPQFDGKKTQKPKNKPPKNPAQNNRDAPEPKKKSSLPTYQLLKLASSKLANGHPYVDVLLKSARIEPNFFVCRHTAIPT